MDTVPAMADDSDSIRYELADEAATAALGAALADALLGMQEVLAAQGIAIGLEGELGAGKTALVRGVLRRAGVAGAVKSPTFALVEPYEVSRLNFYHFDFYRFKDPREFEIRGFGEYFGARAVCFIEWPERAGSYLPQLDLRILLQAPAQAHEAGRTAQLRANTEIGERCLDRLKTISPAAGA